MLDIWKIYLIKIGLSTLLGLFVGYERTQQDKPAGIRDIALVCLGSALFAMIGLEIGGIKNADMARLLYAPIMGICFIGSGVILHSKNKVQGLTTAGVLWIAVAIGLAIGIGNYILGTLSAIAVYLLLKLKHITIKIEKVGRYGRRKKK